MKSKNNIQLCLNAVALSRDNVDAMSDEKVIAIKDTYACHFGAANMNGEVVTKDSFDAMFAAMKETPGLIMPSMNWQHNPNIIIGTWTDLVPDDTGLKVSGILAKGCWDVRERILPLLDAGVPLYLSTEGFVPWDAVQWSEDGDSYTATQFDLIRISLVDIPADFSQREVVTNAIELHREQRIEEPKIEEPKEAKASLLYV